MPARRTTDILVIGAGMAGASIAYFLAGRARVLLAERESQPGYHTTGRSAAIYSATYGNAPVRALTRASLPFLSRPPAGFADHPVLAPRGLIHLATPERAVALDTLARELSEKGEDAEPLDAGAVCARVPVLRPDRVHAGLLERGAQDMDVAAIHQGFLRGARARGVETLCNCALESAERAGGRWLVATTAGEIDAGLIVNAAGAWADDVARRSGVSGLDVAPLRRTAIVFESERYGGRPLDWPVVWNIDETIYFRPEAGRFLASPADESPSEPCDAQPDEFDVAMLIDRLERLTTFDIRRLTAKWAGLRTFAPDRTPVVGPDPRESAFFWFAGQGGYGIQLSAGLAMLGASRVLGDPLPWALEAERVNPADTDPARLAVNTGGEPRPL